MVEQQIDLIDDSELPIDVGKWHKVGLYSYHNGIKACVFHQSGNKAVIGYYKPITGLIAEKTVNSIKELKDFMMKYE